jgi:iron complex outermembrane receptor protein
MFIDYGRQYAMKFNNGTIPTLTVGIAMALAHDAALAQESDAGQLTEIVVTAEKTAESLSKVPISISAVSGAALEEQHITDYADLSRAVPNVSFTSFGGPGQSNIEIRGISSQAGSATTGIYLDDVPINVQNIYTTGSTEPRFFDIDRVEVLRGPQGTIWGAGSMGGTIHFVSNQPNLNNYSGDVHSSLGGTQGGGLNYEGDSVVNLPLVDGVAALRIGALYDHLSGWIDRYPLGPNGTPNGPIADTKINDVNTTVVRATLEWRPMAALTITPSVFLQRVSTGGQNTFSLALPQFESPTLVPETARDQYAITSLTVKYDFGWSELTSVSGYFWRTDDRNIDGTVYDSAYIGGPYVLLTQFPQNTAGAAAISSLAAPVQFNTNVNQVHQELRLASKPGPDDQWSWIAGLYYSRTRTGLLDNEHIPGFTSTFESYYGGTPLSLLGDPFTNDLVYYAFSEFVNNQSAVFGQVTYKPTPQLKLTVGARYEKATEELAFYTAGYLAGGTPPSSGSAKGSATTPRAAISYEVTADTMVYATAAEGFRDGGVNRPVPVPLCSADLAQLGLTQAPPSYNPDKLWSYELGAKTRGFENSLVLSGALFDIRWNNIQTDIILPTCTFDIKDNIGSAESKGVELELNDRLTEHFRVSLGGNYTSAKIVEPVTILGVQKGDHVPGVPDYSVSTSVEYTQPVAASGHGRVSLNAQWIGPSQGTIYHGDPDFKRPSYFVMGGNVGVKWDKFDVSFFITNLLNENKAIQRPNIAGVEYGITVRPRTFGVSGSYSF